MSGMPPGSVTRLTRDLDSIMLESERTRNFSVTLDALKRWRERVAARLATHISSETAHRFEEVGRFDVVTWGDFVSLRQETDKLRRVVRELPTIAVAKSRGRRPLLSRRRPKPAARADIVVITVRDDETAAVLSRLSARRTVIGGQRTYTVGHVETADGRFLSVASLQAPEQGPLAAQGTARDAIDDLEPAWLALVGICGAVPDNEFTLGDVILASRLHAFVLGALEDGKLPQFSDLRRTDEPEGPDLVKHLVGIQNDFRNWGRPRSLGVARPTVNLSGKNFYGSPDYRKTTRAALIGLFRGSTPRTLPQVTARSMGSSIFLLKSSRVITQWRQSARHLAAIEMELAGVYLAARRREKEYRF